MGESADVVRRAFELLAAREVDAVIELLDPEIEFHDPPEVPGSRLYTGHDGFRDWVASIGEAGDLTFRIVRDEERGSAVLTEAVVDMLGASSGAGADWAFWSVWRVRDGLIIYQHGYGSREAAIADFES